MPLSNCGRCGQLFNKVYKNICPSCIKNEEESLEKVRSYIKTNSKTDIDTVSNGTGVPSKLIIQFLREGRIDIAEGKQLVYPCYHCGKPIFTGKACAECTSMIEQLQAAAKDMSAAQQKEKLHSRGIRR
jgi:flagellar operon protein (TIGR03826 family)